MYLNHYISSLIICTILIELDILSVNCVPLNVTNLCKHSFPELVLQNSQTEKKMNSKMDQKSNYKSGDYIEYTIDAEKDSKILNSNAFATQNSSININSVRADVQGSNQLKDSDYSNLFLYVSPSNIPVKDDQRSSEIKARTNCRKLLHENQEAIKSNVRTVDSSNNYPVNIDRKLIGKKGSNTADILLKAGGNSSLNVSQLTIDGAFGNRLQNSTYESFNLVTISN